MPKHNHLYSVYALGPFTNNALDMDLADKAGVVEGQAAYYYGYTFSKKKLERFLKYRKKHRFQVVKSDVSSFTKEEITEFENANRLFEIYDEELVTPVFRVPGAPLNNTGDYIFHITMTRNEHLVIDNELEWYDDYLIDKFSKEDVRTMSILAKCASMELKQALVTSGAIDLLGYLEFLIFGESKIEPSIMLDEVYTFFQYYGELFDF
jgi:hypothetical protein